MRKGLLIIQTVTVVLFMLLISFPLLNHYLDIVEEGESSENRKKAKKPTFDITKLDHFTKEFEKYYSDNFNMRNDLIRYLNISEFKAFNVSPVPHRVTVGDDGWLYASKSLPNYIALNKYSPLHHKVFREELKTRSKWSEERGMKYYLAVIPNKATMYPEHIPNHFVVKRDSARYTQFVSLKDTPGINMIDVREHLKIEKDKGQLLYKMTDDHWNDLGAYYAYKAIIERISKDYPELEAVSLDDYTLTYGNKAGNMASITNLEAYHKDSFPLYEKTVPSQVINAEKHGYISDKKEIQGEHEFVKVNKNGKPLKCLIIRDSFTLAMVKYFQENFEKTVFIHDAWKYRMCEDIIKQEKPDIIINVILETYLDELIKNRFVPKD